MQPKNGTEKTKNFLHELGETILYSVPPITASLWSYNIVGKYIIKFSDSIFLYFLVFAIIYVAIFFIYSYLINWLGALLKYPKTRTNKKKNAKLTYLINTFLIPICISLMIALLPISGETILTRFIKALSTSQEYEFIPKMTKTILESEDLDVKIQGIEALAVIKSDLSLDQLFKILENDQPSLTDYRYYETLLSCFLKFKDKPIPKLIDLFKKSDIEIKKRQSKSIDEYIAESYRPKNLDNLLEQVEDPKTREEIRNLSNEIELLVESRVKKLQNLAAGASFEHSILTFILDVFLSTEDLKRDKDIYFISKSVALDDGYLNSTRRSAILILGKIGFESDFELLIRILDSERDYLKASALQAIGTLHKKIEKLEDDEEPVNSF